MYIYIYTWVYIYIYTWVYIYIYIYIYTYIWRNDVHSLSKHLSQKACPEYTRLY